MTQEPQETDRLLTPLYLLGIFSIILFVVPIYTFLRMTSAGYSAINSVVASTIIINVIVLAFAMIGYLEDDTTLKEKTD